MSLKRTCEASSTSLPSTISSSMFKDVYWESYVLQTRSYVVLIQFYFWLICLKYSSLYQGCRTMRIRMQKVALTYCNTIALWDICFVIIPVESLLIKVKCHPNTKLIGLVQRGICEAFVNNIYSWYNHGQIRMITREKLYSIIEYLWSTSESSTFSILQVTLCDICDMLTLRMSCSWMMISHSSINSSYLRSLRFWFTVVSRIACLYLMAKASIMNIEFHWVHTSRGIFWTTSFSRSRRVHYMGRRIVNEWIMENAILRN